MDSSDSDSGLLSWDRVLDGADERADNAMRRRDLLALAGASTLAGSLASAANTASSFLTELLIPFPLAPSSPTERAVPPDQLLRLSVRVRNQYQACRYDAAAAAHSPSSSPHYKPQSQSPAETSNPVCSLQSPMRTTLLLAFS